MITIPFNDMAPLIDEINAKVEKLSPPPIFFYPYLKRVLEEQWDNVPQTYPMEVKIPKSNKALLKGDFEPERIITINEPLHREDGSPVWFEKTINEAYLRFGYTNEDARFIGQTKMDMEYIHGFLGGSSGHGKSVTLNAMMAALCYEYPPWELQLHLSDAKIIEFKKYAQGHIIPHIASIAATEDADFVISVLKKNFDEMNERAKIFGNIGASNLKSFRKTTGLTYPRVIIIMDEVESTFRNAGKRAGEIAFYIDGFARLGRAAGYHVFLATQNMSADIPKSAIGQIRIRCCLGAVASVSEAILGNDGASENFGRIGKMIANTDVLNGGDTVAGNVSFQTPYLEDDLVPKVKEELETLGKKVGFSWPLSFFDEGDLKLLTEFTPIADKAIARMESAGEFSDTNQVIPLGYPAFVTDDADGLYKLYFNHKDVENVVICSTVTDKTKALIGVMAAGFKHSWNIMHFSSDQEMFEYTPTAITCQEVRECTQPNIQQIEGLIRKRLFLLYVENIAKDENSVSYKRETAEAIFANSGVPKELWGNGLMCRRAVIFELVRTGSEHANMWKPVEGMFPSFETYYKECVKYNAVIEPITVTKFKKVVCFVGDVSKIVGWGRDTQSRQVTAFKKTLLDSNRAAVVIVLYTRSMEGLNEWSSGMRYAIFDTPDTKDWGRMRAEAPGELSPALVVAYDSMDTIRPYSKFKRTLLRDPLAGS